MNWKNFYKILSVISVLFGIMLVLGMNISTVGAVVGVESLEQNITFGFSMFFIGAGILLFVVEMLRNQ